MAWIVIRIVGLVDFFLTLFGHVVYLSLGIYKYKSDDGNVDDNVDADTMTVVRNSSQPLVRNGSQPLVSTTAPGSYERRYIFYLFSNFLLVLQLISAVVLFGASFKNKFSKQFNACTLWMFIALISIQILIVQVCICSLRSTETLACSLEIIFRVICSAFIINYMRNEEE